MKNPCRTAKANILERTKVDGMKVIFGCEVNPVNSPAQFFVAWGKDILANGLIHTFNCETPKRVLFGLLMKSWRKRSMRP